MNRSKKNLEKSNPINMQNNKHFFSFKYLLKKKKKGAKVVMM